MDIVVHEIMDDNTLVEVYKASGGPWGGTVVDEEFKKFVYKLFDNESCLEELWKIAPLDALDLERDFEAKKRNVRASGKLTLRLPQRLKMFSNTNIQDGNNSVTLEHMYIENDEFKSFFTAAKNAIIKIIENILKDIGQIDSVILVGGFSCSKFLRDEVMAYPAFSNIKFLSPFDPGLVVLQGAVLYGYNPQAVSARKARYTYGMRVMRHFNPKIHPESKCSMVDGNLVCKDVFYTVVYEGDLLRYDDEKTYKAMSNHTSKARKSMPIKLELFQAKDIHRDQVVFATDDGMTSVGKIILWPPEEGWPDIVKYELKFYFGQTNIGIESYETGNNIKLKTTFELD